MKAKFIALTLALAMLCLFFTGCSNAEQVLEIVEEVSEVLLEEQADQQESEASSKPGQAELTTSPTEAPKAEDNEEQSGESLIDAAQSSAPLDVTIEDAEIVEYGEPYNETDDVALYLHLYHELPVNYITKAEAEAQGWVSSKGNLWDVTDGCSIGGDKFGNREGLLPKKKGRQYYECDVNYEGGYRGTDRIIFSNDGLVYFTGDHYASFTLLYEDAG